MYLMSVNGLLNMLKANNKLFKLLSKDRTMILRMKKKMKKWILNLMRLMQLRQFLVVMEKRCSCINLKK